MDGLRQKSYIKLRINELKEKRYQKLYLDYSLEKSTIIAISWKDDFFVGEEVS